MASVNFNTGIFRFYPEGKMHMKVKVPSGVTRLDYGTLLFNPAGQKNRLPSKTNEVTCVPADITLLPAGEWVQHCVGAITQEEGIELASDNTNSIPTNFEVTAKNLKEYLDLLIETDPTNTALLPWKYGTKTDGIPIEELETMSADVTVATGKVRFIYRLS